jgi:hypothetical protein
MKKIGSHLAITTILILFSFAMVSAMDFPIVPNEDTLLLLHLDGDADDSSGKNYNGILMNNPDCTVEGRFNQACKFDGINDFIEVPHFPSFETEDGTIVFSFMTSKLSRTQGLISKDSLQYDDGGHFTITTESDNSIKASIQSTAFNRFVRSDANTIQSNEWLDIAFVFGSQKLRLYVNGDEVDSDTYTGGLLGNQEPLVIGASSARSGNLIAIPTEKEFEGLIDEVAFFNRALSQEEIQMLYDTPPVIETEDNETQDGEDTPEVPEEPAPFNPHLSIFEDETLEYQVEFPEFPDILVYTINDERFLIDEFGLITANPELPLAPGEYTLIVTAERELISFNEITQEFETSSETSDMEIRFEILEVPVVETSSSGGGGGGGGSSSTIKKSGDGSCLTEWVCSDWSACIEGEQTRECNKKVEYCVTWQNDPKPAESQPCQEELNVDQENSLEKNGAQKLGSKITGAVIGPGAKKSTIFGFIALIVIVIALYFIVASKKTTLPHNK